MLFSFSGFLCFVLVSQDVFSWIMKKFVPTTPSLCMLRVFQRWTRSEFCCRVFQGQTESLCVVASLSFSLTGVSIPLLLVVSCWTEANGVRYTSKIANSVSSRFSPVPSLTLCVMSNDQCGGNHLMFFLVLTDVCAGRPLVPTQITVLIDVKPISSTTVTMPLFWTSAMSSR